MKLTTLGTSRRLPPRARAGLVRGRARLPHQPQAASPVQALANASGCLAAGLRSPRSTPPQSSARSRPAIVGGASFSLSDPRKRKARKETCQAHHAGRSCATLLTPRFSHYRSAPPYSSTCAPAEPRAGAVCAYVTILSDYQAAQLVRRPAPRLHLLLPCTTKGCTTAAQLALRLGTAVWPEDHSN